MTVKIGHVDRSDQGKFGEAENLALLPWRGGLRRFARFVHTFRILSMEVTWSAQPDSPTANAGIGPSCKLAPIMVNNERLGSEVPRKIPVRRRTAARLDNAPEIWNEKVAFEETEGMKKLVRSIKQKTEQTKKTRSATITMGIDLGDRWSHLCLLDESGEVVGEGRFRTTPEAVEKHFAGVPRMRIAMEAGTHSLWVSELLHNLGHEVIVANVRGLRAITHNDRKSDRVDAQKLARYARVDPQILRPISHRSVAMQEALTLIRAREVLLRLRTATVNVSARTGQALWASAASVFYS